MRLESEFRIRLQLQQIEQAWRDRLLAELTPSSWVKLVTAPSDFSDGEALLLCQHSAGRWFAWVPEYGEILLSNEDFLL